MTRLGRCEVGMPREAGDLARKKTSRHAITEWGHVCQP